MTTSLISSDLPLDDLQRDALTVLALESHEVSRAAWQEMVRRAEIVDGQGRHLTGEGFKQLVKEVCRTGAARSVHEGHYTIDDAWMPRVIESAARARRLEDITARLAMRNRFPSSGAYGPATLSATADLRRALGFEDATTIARVLARATTVSWSYEPWDWVRALGMSAPRRWIEQLPDPFRDAYLGAALDDAFVEMKPIGDDVLSAARASSSTGVRARAMTVLALRGLFDEAGRAVAAAVPTDRWEKGAIAFVALAKGEWDQARRLFAVASTGAKGQIVEPPSYLAAFALLVAATDEAVPAAEVRRRVEKAHRNLGDWPQVHDALEVLAAYRMTGRGEPSDRWMCTSWIGPVFVALVDAWMDLPARDHRLGELRERAATAGYAWVAARIEDLLAANDAGPSLRALRVRRAPWELALDALSAATKAGSDASGGAAARSPAEGALAWEIQLPSRGDGIQITPHLVTARARVGKRISLERLAKESYPLEERDRKIVDALLAASSRWDRSFSPEKLLLFVGHPRVRDETGKPLTVVPRGPELVIERAKSGARAALYPSKFDERGMAISREGDTIVVVQRTEVAARLSEVLGEDGLHVPDAGIARLHQVIASLSGAMPVRAPGVVAGEKEDSDPRTRVQLFRAGSGLRARLRVTPGGSSGAAFRAGEPPIEVVVAREAGLSCVRRDLGLERKHEQELLERCPILASLPVEGDDRVARELDVCLELLLELKDAGAIIEWPEGQALRVPIARRADEVRVRVGGGANWLDVEGEVKVDEERVIQMRDLLAAASRARGRFVPIGDDQFLALTDDLRNKLDALGRAQELASKGRLSTALLPAIEGWVDGLDVTWSEEIERRRAALAKASQSAPRVPRALAAELRDYQRDGFVFLARRAEAGLGACLADDMGLGKTVQALALLLHRASGGPALVVAPMSVCRNWEEEATRFAPTLRIVRLAEGDREEAIRGARAGDVVVASYGLLVSAEELLAARRFNTIVFDEAHALKNASTRRWKAARAMQADATLALTGTPVENHVGELHAVLDVLVPGMLGPRAAFERGFGAAVAEGDRSAVAALRQVVRPLVLRRTKSQVLQELPPKTEMTRVVLPTPEQRAFYEAARRRALEQVTGAASSGGHARIQILAEITRLRRAAIDPRLVGGDLAPPGAKLDALVELVAELREEGHRTLIFSQFLEVLDLAKERLEAVGVECRRLDGTMSAAARKSEVDAFQSGRGDVFLLSLKAGGVGMNLTGADFVVHLDPWWNPAVEDQATDRAHRIGQARPVTIVRLVTGGTIEEKVLALHGAKRRLYEDVVGAADGTGTLDVATLAELLGRT